MIHPFLRNLFLCLLLFGALIAGPDLATAEEGHATLLLSMQPHKLNGKKWDIGKGADPVICLKHGCYVGRGFIAPAKFYKDRSALYPFVKARACSNSLTCIYRTVLIPEKQAQVWPVDLDGVHYDKMQKRQLGIDHSCQIKDNQLSCLNGIYTAEYSLWVVPEKIADRAGKKLLDYALFKGIYEARKTGKLKYIKEQRINLPEVISQFYYAVRGKPTPWSCEKDPEAIIEAFYIAGIFPNTRREILTPLAKVLVSEEDLATSTLSKKLESPVYWELYKAIEKMRKYTRAERYRVVTNQKGLRLLKGSTKKTLFIGWDVKSRADKVILSCDTARRESNSE